MGDERKPGSGERGGVASQDTVIGFESFVVPGRSPAVPPLPKTQEMAAVGLPTHPPAPPQEPPTPLTQGMPVVGLPPSPAAPSRPWASPAVVPPQAAASRPWLVGGAVAAGVVATVGASATAYAASTEESSSASAAVVPTSVPTTVASPPAPTATPVEPPAPAMEPIPAPPVGDEGKAVPVLGSGAHGAEVLKLQQRLNALGYRLDEDGTYGPQTAAAVSHLQARSGIPVDGLAGPLTDNAVLQHESARHTHLGDHWERESRAAGLSAADHHGDAASIESPAHGESKPEAKSQPPEAASVDASASASAHLAEHATAGDAASGQPHAEEGDIDPSEIEPSIHGGVDSLRGPDDVSVAEEEAAAQGEDDRDRPYRGDESDDAQDEDDRDRPYRGDESDEVADHGDHSGYDDGTATEAAVDDDRDDRSDYDDGSAHDDTAHDDTAHDEGADCDVGADDGSGYGDD